MEDNAHALPCCNQCRDSDEEADHGDGAPCTACAAECEDDGDEQAGNNAKDAESASEDDTRTIAVADGPTHKVGVCLAAK